jgi:hypothetical protein
MGGYKMNIFQCLYDITNNQITVDHGEYNNSKLKNCN